MFLKDIINPGMIIPDGIVISNDAKLSIDNADYVLLATPSIYIRSTLMPITNAVNEIINNNKDPKEILVQLMNRPSKHELV